MLFVTLQGVKLDDHGNIQVDEYQNTGVPGIYALGDVCGKALLTPGARKLYRKFPTCEVVGHVLRNNICVLCINSYLITACLLMGDIYVG